MNLHLDGPVLLGPDDVRPEAWVLDGRITYDRPSLSCDRVEGFFLPGLVDAHNHIGLGAHGAVSAEEAVQQALADRAAGALLLRDAGSPSDTRWVDDRDDLPVLVRAGRHVARTRRYLRDFAAEVEPDDLVQELSRQAERGDGWVKLVGDWIDRETGDLSLCWPVDVLAPAIAAAQSLGARVTAHCFSEDSLVPLAEAGIDCVEHATGLTETSIPVLAERGVAIVPTLVNIETFPGIATAAEEKFPLYAGHMRDLHARRYDTVMTAWEAGIAVYAGTDAGGSLAHGLIGQEAVELRKAGLPVDAVLGAVSWEARPWLGFPGLDEGAQADVVVCAEDPRVSLETLLAPRAVVLRGRPW